MESKQAFAKIGVFVLLGINVCAYYYFWPRHDDATKATAKAVGETKGEAQLLPAKAPVPPVAEPSPLPKPVIAQAAPLAIPGPIPVVPVANASGPPGTFVSNGEETLSAKENGLSVPENDTAAILKLLDHINREKLPDLPAASVESATRVVLAKQPGEPVLVPMPPIQQPEQNPLRPIDNSLAIAPPVPAKTSPAVWIFHTDKIGLRTQLTVRLREPATQHILVEFRIECDRVEMKQQNGAVLALGNVNFIGAGWKGSCGKLTLPVYEPKLLFEDHAEIMQDILGTALASVVRGDKLVWELPPPSASAGVTQPLFARPGLGSPDN